MDLEKKKKKNSEMQANVKPFFRTHVTNHTSHSWHKIIWTNMIIETG
jgi:hypothetical protein